MNNLPKFTGYNPKAIQFFAQLEHNNNRDWFQEHKSEYEEYIKLPTQSLVQAIGEQLIFHRPYINADIKRSPYRIYRDIRFKKDKTPYKTWQSIIFWEGSFKRTENPGFFVSLSANQISIGAGSYLPPKEFLPRFRELVIGEKAKEFTKIIRNLEKKGYELLGKEYKRYPRGYTGEELNAEYLLYKRIYTIVRLPIDETVYSEKLVDICMKYFKDFMELHNFLVEIFKEI